MISLQSEAGVLGQVPPDASSGFIEEEEEEGERQTGERPDSNTNVTQRDWLSDRRQIKGLYCKYKPV